MSTTSSEPFAGEVSFAERVAEYAATQGIPPYEGPDLGDTPMRQREELVERHGVADGLLSERVYPGRTVIEVPGWPWPVARPEDCPDANAATIWFDPSGNPLPGSAPLDAEGVVLLCSLCGLDST